MAGVMLLALFSWSPDSLTRLFLAGGRPSSPSMEGLLVFLFGGFIFFLFSFFSWKIGRELPGNFFLFSFFSWKIGRELPGNFVSCLGNILEMCVYRNKYICLVYVYIYIHTHTSHDGGGLDARLGNGHIHGLVPNI